MVIVNVPFISALDADTLDDDEDKTNQDAFLRYSTSWVDISAGVRL